MTARDDTQKAQLLARTLALRSARKFISQTLREMATLRAIARTKGETTLLEPDEALLKSYRDMLNQIDEALKR